MFSLLSVKAMRLLLSITVSVWMAGGCLFGCSGTVVAADLEVGASPQTVVAGESCHAPAPSHDCCAAKKPGKKKISNTRQPEGLPAFMPGPRGMMKDCPLVVNGTAATSKSSGRVADPGSAPVATLPLIETNIEQFNVTLVKSFLPNRGPTHLRCCVFLI